MRKNTCNLMRIPLKTQIRPHSSLPTHTYTQTHFKYTEKEAHFHKLSNTLPRHTYYKHRRKKSLQLHLNKTHTHTPPHTIHTLWR